MPRPRTRRRVDLSGVEAIVAGEVDVGLNELLELVRRVNPTRLCRSSEETARRYALKARLQSRILRDFWSEVLVVPTSRRGVVGIRRRGVRGDACHAVVAHLDRDVQARLRAVLAQRFK
jgi:hypothetical protein